MWLGLAILLGVLALLFAAPLVPIDLAVDASGDALAGRGRFRARMEWLFGLVHKDLGGNAERPRRESRRLDLGAMLRTDGFIDAIARLAGRSWRATRVRELAARGRFGTGDPAETGRALGFASPVLAIANAVRGGVAAIEPAWTELALEGDLRGRIRVHPYPVLAAFLAFVLTPATRSAWRAGRRAA